MGIRDTGFGLNYNMGFKGGRGAGSGGISTGQNEAQGAFDRIQHDKDLAGAMARARLPIDAQQSRFNQLFPFLQGQLGNFQSGAFTAGGQSGPGPEYKAGPIWNQDQIQGQVNALRASNDQSTAGRTTQMQKELAGRGFGSSSPLAASLAAQFQGQRMAENTRGERETRWGAAEGNAAQELKGFQALEQQFASRQGEDIERRKPYIQGMSGLLASIANLFG